MAQSLFDLFKPGIGPSSSHTSGPMLACFRFVKQMYDGGLLNEVFRVRVDLYGSLALTGLGHGTDRAVILGLSGNQPKNVDPKTATAVCDIVRDKKLIKLLGRKKCIWNEKDDLVFNRRKSLPAHPNGIIIAAFDATQTLILEKTYYSIGGGTILDSEEIDAGHAISQKTTDDLPHLFNSGLQLLLISEKEKLSIPEIVMANECFWRPKREVTNKLSRTWSDMTACIDRGLTGTGELPGRLKVQRRANAIYLELTRRTEESLRDPLAVLDWVNLYAIAVNEENASGGKVVTAPTNGAAGIIPAVIRYYERFCNGSEQKGIFRFLLAATAIGSLYAKNASLSGAEVGCQGEVGVACSMAAGGLVAALNGSSLQIEQAAEIGMEHNLGLTCDPIGGFVQIPCIERNAMGAIKAINACRIAMRGNGHHFVSLDSVIKTMKETGRDMKKKYKETSRGGLAVNVPLC